MSEFSSVRTSRINSQLSALSSKKSSHHSDAHSVLSYASTHLTEFLADKLLMDEYGITDKQCRNCSQCLSFEQILALCVPMDSQGRPLNSAKDIDFDKIDLICLKCYAEQALDSIVANRRKVKIEKSELEIKSQKNYKRAVSVEASRPVLKSAQVRTSPRPVYKRVAKSYYGDTDKGRLYSQLKQAASFKRRQTDITKYSVRRPQGYRILN